MNVATRPWRRAMLRTTKRRVARLSAVGGGLACRRAISCWPRTTPGCDASGAGPLSPRAATITPPPPPPPPTLPPRRTRRPGEHAERVAIRDEQRVGLFHAREPFQRRAVEDHLARQRALELGRRHFDRLVHTEEVGELQQQEADLALSQVP